ncbi:hypothetical protein [Echinicola vietnamensis]|uniref:Uncharacterized protein n=1 Tax=Echinicola vietnamensis (strain DSM 17526 / LMG 23754 / KMM 6221) TaxID=926556 RepID=L0G0T9_ECHVK|nr:hypothetical protein [Echinicola vietnamensis]AGA79819.1 Protein of unknown function (DUF3253) [Echinicola vietnamensis DSM 17526]
MDNILEIAILEMGRQKGSQGFSCEEVIQWIYPEDWVHFREEIRQTARALEEEGKISLMENGEIKLRG